ncbi:MAG: hypothetical protein JWO67_4836, partial [Streptosporangiaceae bacterium]|nr:hypothetical protein [Streptosporangiaceae bacterium]
SAPPPRPPGPVATGVRRGRPPRNAPDRARSDRRHRVRAAAIVHRPQGRRPTRTLAPTGYLRHWTAAPLPHEPGSVLTCLRRGHGTGRVGQARRRKACQELRWKPGHPACHRPRTSRADQGPEGWAKADGMTRRGAVREDAFVNAPDDRHDVMIPRGPSDTYVRLSAFQRPDDDALVLFEVKAEAPGISATIGIETFNSDGLSEFIQSLEDDFRGWPGERVWRSFRRDLQLQAAHLGQSIRLSWTLRPSEWDAEWTATVDLQVSPGEELKNLAADVGHFFGHR